MQIIQRPINEGSSRVLRVPFYDAAGQPVVDANVTGLFVTIRDVASGTKIRDNQSVLNANGGTFLNGVLSLTLSGADTAAVGVEAESVVGRGVLQERLLTVDLTASGNLRITDEVAYRVRVLEDIA